MKFTLAFDSDCGPCTRFMKAISFLDARNRMEYIGLSEAEAKGLLDVIPMGLRRRSFHLISPGGEVKSGTAAFPDLARLLPAGRLSYVLLKRSAPVTRATASLYVVLSRLHDTGACPHQEAKAKSRSISTSIENPSALPRSVSAGL